MVDFSESREYVPQHNTEVFEELKKNQPRSGEVLTTVTGKWIRLGVSQKNESGEIKYAMFCRCAIDVEKKGWFLTNKEIGIVCLILPQSQELVVETEDGRFYVRELQVVRYTENGRALLCEVID